MSSMESRDNQIGLALALSSSAFIGSSFIVKKKGLIRARSSGSGAGDGGFAYLRESLWWIGLLTMIFGEIANFAAYAFAPAILVTPLGALSVIVSAVLASLMLNEVLLVLGKVGCALCIIGSTIIVLNAPEEAPVESVSQIVTLMETNVAFQMYAFFVLASTLYLIYYAVPRSGKTNILIYVTICSVVGSISVIACKALGIAIKLTAEGSNQFIEPSTWGFVFLVGISVVTQMNYLNKALDTFNTALVTPIYYVIFTTCTIIASAILFKGWGQEIADENGLPVETTVSPSNCTQTSESYSAGSLVTCFSGFLTICAGVFLLHTSREEAQRRSSGVVERGGRNGRGFEAIPMDEFDRKELVEGDDDANPLMGGRKD